MSGADVPVIFAPAASSEFADKVADHVGVELSPLEEREFEDGEHKIRPLCNVRGRRVFVIHSLYAEPAAGVNDKLCRLLFLIGALRDAGAGEITAVLPYLAYARKDQRSQPRDPVSSRYVAQLLESVGVDGVVTLDVHNRAAFQNAFRCMAVALNTTALFADYLSGWLGNRSVCIVSPDTGGIKRAQALRERFSTLTGLEAGAAFMEKYRALGKVTGERLIGDVSGSDVVIVDDLISSGGTIARTADACRRDGGRRILVLATHGLFVGDAECRLSAAGLDRLVVTDTVPPLRLGSDFIQRRLETLSVAPFFADAIMRLSRGGSIVELVRQIV